MSSKLKHALIIVGAVLIILKFRTQLAGVVQSWPVIGGFVG